MFANGEEGHETNTNGYCAGQTFVQEHILLKPGTAAAQVGGVYRGDG
jgi:hypothetical protein